MTATKAVGRQVSKRGHAITLAAMATQISIGACADAGVFLRERVTVFADRFGEIGIALACVLRSREQLKMIGAHTRCVATHVVDGQSLRNGTVLDFPRDAMRHGEQSASAAETYAAISSLSFSRSPYPATFGSLYLLPEPNL